jgi:CheY-like chemotaxis protein
MSKPARILVVDDQAWVRHTLRSLLAQQGLWRIYEAENGKVALDLIHEIQPHVVVADLVMPGMNGIELAYEIRQLEDAPKIILISSHYTPEEAAVLARLFGDGNFVPKSEAGELLVPAISRLLPEECQAKVITA